MFKRIIQGVQNNLLYPFTRPYLTAYLVLFGLLSMSLVLEIFVIRSLRRYKELEFQKQSNEITRQISIEVYDLINLLESTASVISISPEIEKEEFRNYIDTLDLENSYKGILGLGLALKVDRTELAEFNKRLALNDELNFSIFPNYARDIYFPIIYIEPEDERNKVVLGYDMFTEEIRREAMQRSIDTGNVTSTGKVSLLQEIDQNKQAGLLFYKAIYESKVPVTPEERLNNLFGFIYAPVRSQDFILSAIGNINSRGIGIKIIDFNSNALNNVMVDIPVESPETSLIGSTVGSTIQTTNQIELPGRNWQVELTYTPSFSSKELLPALLLLPAGLLLALISFYLAGHQTALRLRSEEKNKQLGIIQEALVQSNNSKSSILNSLPAYIIVINELGDIIEVNKSIRDLNIQKNPIINSSLIGKNIYNMLYQSYAETHESSTLMIINNIKEITRRQKSIVTFEQLIVIDSIPIWFQVNITPFENVNGGVVITFTDISKLKELEKQKETFIGVASHELKTPLTSIKAYGQLLENYEKLHPSKQREFITKLNDQISRLSLLVTQLLDISRIENNRLVLVKTHFDLNELLMQTIEEIQYLNPSRNIILHNPQSVIVIGDKDRIAQVIINLLNNAIKYSEPSTPIDVYLNQIDHSIELVVQDYGIGIPVELHQKIFDRFSQADGLNQQRYSGLGLGLYISKEIINLHQGEIGVFSNVGEGSKFFIRLPIGDVS